MPNGIANIKKNEKMWILSITVPLERFIQPGGNWNTALIAFFTAFYESLVYRFPLQTCWSILHMSSFDLKWVYKTFFAPSL